MEQPPTKVDKAPRLSTVFISWIRKYAQVVPQMVASHVVATTLPPTISSSNAENVTVVKNQLVHLLDEV